MKNSKYSLLLVLLLAVSVFLAACGGNKDKAENDKNTNEPGETSALADNQEITVLESAEIPSMDSVMAQDTVGFSMLNNTNEGLYRINQNQDVEPALVDGEPTVSEDGKVYTFKLKETQWSNGDPVTAHDFVYAWQRAIDPETASPYGAYMMEGKIAGATEAFQSGDVTKLGIKALGDYELEVTLAEPIPFFESLMAFPTFFPQNQKFVEEQGDAYASKAENLLANGPFKLTTWDGVTASTWTLEKNETYWDADKVTLTKINYNVSKDPQASANAFEAGEADVTPKLSTPAVITQYEGDPRLVTWLEPSIFWLKMNQGNEALANKNIRMAISLAFDKDALVNDILQNGSLAANYAVPAEFVKDPESGEDYRAANGDMNTYNVDEAKKYWEKGLAELGTDKVELSYLSGDSETSKTMDAYIVDQLQNNLPGLKLNLESVPFSVRLDRETKENFDILHSGWGPDYQDAMTFADLWVTGGGNNHMGYSNPEYDKLINDANTTLATDPVARTKALQQAEAILFEDAAIAPTYQRAVNILVNEKVEGFTYHTFGPEYSWKYAQLMK